MIHYLTPTIITVAIVIQGVLWTEFFRVMRIRKLFNSLLRKNTIYIWYKQIVCDQWLCERVYDNYNISLAYNINPVKSFNWKYWNVEAFMKDKNLYKDMNSLSELEMIEKMREKVSEEILLRIGVLIPVTNSTSTS